MNRKHPMLKPIVGAGLLLFPSLALASGDPAILYYLLLAMATHFFGFVALVTSKIFKKNRVLLLFVYLGSVFGAWMLAGNMPVAISAHLVAIALCLLPIVLMLIVFMGLAMMRARQ